ncbi:MAG: alpha/beta fold hydrolase [Ornithinimicrobium sp.]
MSTVAAAPEPRFLQVADARVHWVDFGGPDAPEALCVMVHGLGGSTVNWESLVPALIGRFRCVALDIVGFGMTEPGSRSARVQDNTDLLETFVAMARERYGPLPLLLIGNSMGGLISARYAAARRCDVAGVVLLDPTVPPAHLVPGAGGLLAAGLYAVPMVGRTAARARRSLRTPTQNVQDTLRLCTVDPARVDPAVVARHLPVAERRLTHPEMDRHYSDAARSILTLLRRRAHTDRTYADIAAPVLLVHGKRDRLVPFSGACRMARRNPAWRFVPAHDCGHLPMLERPQWLAGQILTWWQGREPVASTSASVPVTVELACDQLGLMADLQVLRRKASTLALLAFRALPGPLKRALVRAGTPNYTVGAVCSVEHDGHVLMLSQPHRNGWSLPGGLLDHGETPAEAVIREVAEETGLRIDPGDEVAVGVHPNSQSVDVIFRVVLEQRPSLTLSSEARRSRWMSVADMADSDRETQQILHLLRASGEEPTPGRLLD